mmetsp:Transcript_11423/g.34332  ORF Transcript_11423/g.34332 Transcript_11423/m.34332 type:complete len:313 (-) Transcript_11423:363-1301(-)
MQSYRFPFNGYAVKWSPFVEGRIAVAAAQNFGIVGNGRQIAVQVTPQGMQEVAGFDTVDGLYDCAWSETNENILASACGDGSIKVWDVAAPPRANPLRSLQEHAREVCSLSWNTVHKTQFLSASWDDTAKLWDSEQPQSLRTFGEHTYCVYAAIWNPAHGDVFVTASGDHTAKVWDVRQPRSTLTIAAHQHELLAADWCKYNDCVIATGSVDKTIKTWDVRMPQREVAVLTGHTYAVRRVVFSPHAENILASCSYDMTVRLWDAAAPANPQLNVWGHHTEFAVGLDFSILSEGMLASTGWDEQVAVFRTSGV